MREVAAIIEPAIDIAQIERELQREIIAMQDADRAEATAVERAGKTAEAARRQRVTVGARLIEAKRAVKHGQWLPWLERMGIEQQRASEWMRLAGHVESKLPTSANGGNLPAPTLADAGIDKRPRKRDEESTPVVDDSPSTDWQREIEARRAPMEAPVIDIDRELSRIQNKICAFAESVPARARKQIAHELRETARLIEEMP
jgi:hypothetical protein